MSAPTDKSAKLICARRARCFQRAHLSALTLAALATGYYPDGSAPEPGFPRRRLTRVLPASPKSAAVKHAPCGPVFVPVDRGPEAAREREGRTPARGHRISLSSIRRHRLTSLNNGRGSGVYCRRFRQVKGVGISFDESAHLAQCGFQRVRRTPMIRMACRHGRARPGHPRLWCGKF
jgi:hypothetical protein